MYLVIVCAHCGGSSQIEEGALGKMVECPLCNKPTLARTREAVLPVAKPIDSPPAPSAPVTASSVVPLSLDEDPIPPDSITNASLATAKAAKGPSKRTPLRTALYASGSLFLTLLLMGGIYGLFRYGSGDIPSGAWKTYSPPDGRCSVLLPGDPEVQDIPAEEYVIHGNRGGKRFTVWRWFERVRVSFGWIDLDAERLKGVQFDQISIPFREGELKRLNGQLKAESIVNFVVGKRKFESALFQIEADGQKHIVQIFLEAESDRRRLYIASVSGKKVAADTAWVQKFFNSFVPEQ